MTTLLIVLVCLAFGLWITKALVKWSDPEEFYVCTLDMDTDGHYILLFLSKGGLRQYDPDIILTYSRKALTQTKLTKGWMIVSTKNLDFIFGKPVSTLYWMCGCGTLYDLQSYCPYCGWTRENSRPVPAIEVLKAGRTLSIYR